MKVFILQARGVLGNSEYDDQGRRQRVSNDVIEAWFGADITRIYIILRDPNQFLTDFTINHLVCLPNDDMLAWRYVAIPVGSVLKNKMSDGWRSYSKQSRMFVPPYRVTNGRQYRGSRVCHCWHNWREKRYEKIAAIQSRPAPKPRQKKRR